MAITLADLEAFQRFAAERLAAQGAESLSDLLCEWESSRERQETIESAKRGLADVDAVRTRPAADVLKELRSGLASK
ncbi:MAG: hypothetical protein AB7O59_21835 [Pirellulales bacterium]